MDMKTDAAGVSLAAQRPVSPVSSHNEWDPLEEIIVGRLEGAVIPSSHPVVTCNIPGMAAWGKRSPPVTAIPRSWSHRRSANSTGSSTLLESLGVTVRRPDAVDHKAKFGTPEWSSRGFCNSCPRDSMLVIGEEIIETPMAWPCRYFETHSYRPILKDYFRQGARWTSAPKPQLSDRTVRPRFPSAREGRTDALHPHRVRTRVRCRRFLPLRARSVRHPQQRDQC